MTRGRCADYDGTEEYPLVFSWHGHGSTSADHLAYADFRPLAESEHFLVVAPQAAGAPTPFNLEAGIVGDTDDVAFTNEIIDRDATECCLDASRVYSSGVSNGGGMSAPLACRAPERFAAIGIDALLLRPEPCATPAPAVLGVMGNADLVVPFQGGRANCCGGWPIAPAVETMTSWAAHAGCDGDGREKEIAEHVDRTTWTGCDGDVEIQYYVIDGRTHLARCAGHQPARPDQPRRSTRRRSCGTSSSGSQRPVGSVAAVELSSVRYSDAPVQLILVHGLASNAQLWDGVGGELAARGVGALAVDLRGHGQSPKPDAGYDFDSVVGDLLPFLDGAPVVVGQSYGGNVVVHLAARHPDTVRGVVCVDGGAIDLRQRFPGLEDAVKALRPPYELFEGTAADVMEARLRASIPDGPETWVQGAMACWDVVDGGIRSRLTWSRHRQIIEAMWHDPPTELLPKVEVPVLFVMASERMRDDVDAALDALPNGRAVWLEGAHHDVHAQRPAQVAQLLIEAL